MKTEMAFFRAWDLLWDRHAVVLLLFMILHGTSIVICTNHHIYNIHWNTSNSMFSSGKGDNIIDINGGNHHWEYDQVNIVCPVYKPGTDPHSHEQYIIYSVTKQEFESCRITQPNPKIVALCNRPYEVMYFTITFRSFTPTPGGLEFRPGQDYYFISTSTRDDIHRRVGGGCSSHNMKVIFRVAASNRDVTSGTDSSSANNEVDGGSTRPTGAKFPWSESGDFRRTFSYYYPSSAEESGVGRRRQMGRRPKTGYDNAVDEVSSKREASPMLASASSRLQRSFSCASTLVLLLASWMAWAWCPR